MAGASKKSISEDVLFDKALKMPDGVFVHNYIELASHLKLISDQEFSMLVNSHHDKISAWIDENYGDSPLMAGLKRAGTRQKYASLIQAEIDALGEGGKKRKDVNAGGLPLLQAIGWLVLIAFIAGLVYLATTEFSGVKKSGENQAAYLTQQLFDKDARILMLENQVSDLKRNLTEFKESSEPAANSNISMARPKISGIYPGDHIGLADVKLGKSSVIIYLNRPFLSKYYDTGSMQPVLGKNSNGIEIRPKSESDIRIGDIISYAGKDSTIIVHRVIETGNDSLGWYAIAKGDAAGMPDQGRVRFSDVKGIVVGVLY